MVALSAWCAESLEVRFEHTLIELNALKRERYRVVGEHLRPTRASCRPACLIGRHGCVRLGSKGGRACARPRSVFAEEDAALHRFTDVGLGKELVLGQFLEATVDAVEDL